MILVTGATGRIGGELVKNLVASGEQVRAMVRNPARAATIQGQGVETIVGDLEKPETSTASIPSLASPTNSIFGSHTDSAFHDVSEASR